MKYSTNLVMILLPVIFNISCRQNTTPSKPNIILLMCDQFRYDRLGVMGDPIIQTPNLDALTSEGLLFTNAYCPSPVCAPSRAALKTGLFPPGNGMVANWVPFKEKVADTANIYDYLLPERLRAQGYYTGMVGKLHFVPAEDKFGFDFKSLHDAPYSVYANDDKHSEYIKWLRKNHFKTNGIDFVSIFDRDESYYPDSIYKFILGSGWRTEEQHDVPWTIQESINFLDIYDQDKPFFLFTSIFGPHQPYLAPTPWDSLYNPDDIILGPRFYAEMENSPIFQMNHGNLAKRLRSNWSDQKFKEVIAAYYGQISMIDHYLGKIFDQLKEKGIWENTWIIFLADHGDFNGAYGTFFKGEMYDASVKIPLIIKPPSGYGAKGKRAELVNSIDLYGTILDIAGDEEWKDLVQMESISLLPLIQEDKNLEWNNSVYSIIGSSPEESLCMLRTGSMKIIRKSIHGSDPVYELYNFTTDPYETQNVYGQHAYLNIGKELKLKLDSWWDMQAVRYPEKLDHSYKK
jgi:arylsulfatase A-like enzyme